LYLKNWDIINKNEEDGKRDDDEIEGYADVEMN
jgi:hypothetical protein